MRQHSFRIFIAACLLFTIWAPWSCDRTPAPLQPGTRARRTQPVGPSTRPLASATTKPVAQIAHAIVISVDGLRPDLIYRSGAQNILLLTRGGAFTLWAHSAELPLTLPSHSSMFTGVKPSRHGIQFNEGEPDIYPAYPTLFEVARRCGLTTALVTGKAKLQVLARPGSLNWQSVKEQDADAVADEVVRLLKEHQPHVTGVHFNECDYAGHANGWGSPEQLAAVKKIDGCIGRILAGIDDAGMAKSTLVIVTADHGGSGYGHGADPPGSTIPWIAFGPGLRRGFDLERIGFFAVHVEDTFATVSWMLGLQIHPDIDGKPVTQILERRAGEELLEDARE